MAEFERIESRLGSVNEKILRSTEAPPPRCARRRIEERRERILLSDELVEKRFLRFSLLCLPLHRLSDPSLESSQVALSQNRL